ncbi:DeoR/GlpR family DNA-binding transcription regulator [Oribacterium sp. oral taxon 108]|uniref:DeoR/GlpR family DNA-binding transcription regulator n=1 Tax=Oribacterium sp. oral taxon 108 TaxID=712414 RepID=UPI00020DD8A9|nr:DeoR/GlpR family DNA-binding transcription regulator [Oribacterium sp. oral taxon 108]EGL36128.1 transcriptional regulator, DeoR family [Oribacterium sp. oral taxon 108 str. F0425]
MKNSKANVEARQKNILQYVRKAGEVNSYDLVDEFKISIMTVRRDLEELEQKHLLKRTHGGACTLDYVKGSKSLSKNIRICRDLISRYASSLIKDNDRIFINGSRTALKMLEYVGNKNVTVYTNNGLAFGRKFPENVSIHMTGGELRNHILVGDATMRNILDVTANKTFIGCWAVYDDGAFLYNIPNEIGINEAMISRTTEDLYILADHSKLQRHDNLESSYGSCIYDRKVTLITDNQADAEIIEKLRASGIEIIIV